MVAGETVGSRIMLPRAPVADVVALAHPAIAAQVTRVTIDAAAGVVASARGVDPTHPPLPVLGPVTVTTRSGMEVAPAILRLLSPSPGYSSVRRRNDGVPRYAHRHSLQIII